MKGQRSIFDPFLEGVDLNQGLNSSSDESDDWNVLSPIERRLLNNDLSSELNFNCVNRNNHQNHNFRSFSNWDVGESSSRASLQQDQTSNESPTVGVQNSASNHIPMNVNLNIGYGSTNHDDGDDDGMPLPFIDLYKTEDERGPASSLGNWGLSCKRKTLEGSTSTQPVIGGSSNSLNISLGSVNPVAVDRHEPPNTRIGDTNNNVLLVANTNRRQTVSAFHQSSTRQDSVNEFLDQTSSNLTNQQPPITPRSGPNYHWGNNIASSSLRNSVRYHNFVPLPEPRNLVQDPTNWSLATGSTTTSGGAVTTAASTRNVGGSRSFNVVRNQNNPTTQSQQRSTDVPPWTLFPEVESGAQRRNFTGASSSSSSTLEDNQRHHIQPFSRSALLMVAGDDWHALAADIEGRQRLVSEIRQVLNAMRRGENLRAEV